MDRYGSIVWKKGMRHEVYVVQLQKDLKALGFGNIGAIDGNFGRKTFWALREFQSYAKYATVAKLVRTTGPLHSRLAPVATGNQRYLGHIDGVANDDTRTLLEHWLASDWRCPVVINAWEIDSGGQKISLEAQNVWHHDDHEVSSSTIGFFAHDVSGQFPNAGVLADGSVLLGQYKTYGSFGGPLSTPPKFTQPSAEILPENLVGRPFTALNAFEQSTFRVVRAVSEVECLGFFDCINAYDSAIISAGPCHWTLGLVKRRNNVGQVYDGELCGTLAYAAWSKQAEFDRYLTFFGVNIRDSWVGPNGVSDGAELFDRDQFKFASWLSFIDENGDYSAVPNAEEDGNYFKSWHWIYRFTAAMRESAGLRLAIWDMARVRLRDVGRIKVQIGGAIRTVDEIFTSEKARALLHRWHIYRPGEISSSGPGTALRRIVQRAQAGGPGGWGGNPTNWTNAHETALLNANDAIIQDMGNADLKNTTANVSKWPGWHGPGTTNPRKYQLAHGLTPLSTKRGSFKFDNTGLPPAPP